MLRHSQDENEIIFNDEELKKTYVACNNEEYRTNLLGFEKDSIKKLQLVPIKKALDLNKKDSIKKFQLVPIKRALDLNKIEISDIEQGDLGNCVFLSLLRAIVRRDHHFIKKIITNVDETHVKIRLFSPERKDGVNRFKQVNYRIQKTIFEPVYPTVFSQIFYNFCKMIDPCESFWVKLIEKALVIHYMNREYPYSLMCAQINGEIPTYETVVKELSQKFVYSALLGCKVKAGSFKRVGTSTKIIEDAFISGELITVSFIENEIGIQHSHAYELINYGENHKGKFVILSNPWGFNEKINIVDYIQPALSTLKMAINYPEIGNEDRSIVILPIKEFNEIVDCYRITSKATIALSKSSNGYSSCLVKEKQLLPQNKKYFSFFGEMTLDYSKKFIIAFLALLLFYKLRMLHGSKFLPLSTLRK